VGAGLAHFHALQRGDHFLAVGGAGLGGNGGAAFGKPFDLLQLDAVPGRVADHGVKAVAAARAKHGGEAGPPVEKSFAPGQRAGACQQRVGRAGGVVLALQPPGGQGGHQVLAGLQQFEQGGVFGVLAGLELGGAGGGVLGQLEQLRQPGRFVHGPAGDEPAQRAPEVQHRVQGRHLRGGLGGQLL